jgi:hypothetical protein
VPAGSDAGANTAMHIVGLTDEARKDWLAFARYVEQEMLPGAAFQHATDWAGKAPGMAVRIAGVLHGIKHAHGMPWATPISAVTMEKGLELAAVLMKHALAALALMGADEGVETSGTPIVVYRPASRACRISRARARSRGTGLIRCGCPGAHLKQ